MKQTTDGNELNSGEMKANEPFPAPLLQTWNCIRCEMEEEEYFKAPLQTGGYLPNCPKCGTSYKVFEVQGVQSTSRELDKE